MEKKSNLFLLLGYFYIILPIVIFLIGYCNLFTAIIGVGLIAFCSYFVCKDCPQIWIPQNKKEWWILGAVLFIITIWVCYSGIGALSFQNSDHTARNAIFEILVNENWPVIQDKFVLTYYIGFWLPAAVVGKIFNSITAGYITQMIWAVVGVFLTMYYVMAVFKKKLWIPLLIFMFFSGLDILGSVIIDLMSGVSPLKHSFNLFLHLEWYFPMYQFSSFTTQLYWVFNQAIPAWIIMMFLYHQKDNRNMILIYSCMFLCSTLPAVGMFPIVFYLCLKNGENDIKKIFTKSHTVNALKSALSLQNIIGAFFITPITYFYLANNISGEHVANMPSATGTQVLGFQFYVIWFLLFFMLEVGLYLVSVFKNNKTNPMFYIISACLLFYPFIQVGSSNDFCMRATIPALFILYFYVVNMFYEENDNKFIIGMLTVLLIIGSITPIHEIARSVYYSAIGFTKVESVMEAGSGNFYGYVEGNKFLEYFGKK